MSFVLTELEKVAEDFKTSINDEALGNYFFNKVNNLREFVNYLKTSKNKTYSNNLITFKELDHFMENGNVNSIENAFSGIFKSDFAIKKFYDLFQKEILASNEKLVASMQNDFDVVTDYPHALAYYLKQNNLPFKDLEINTIANLFETEPTHRYFVRELSNNFIFSLLNDFDAELGAEYYKHEFKNVRAECFENSLQKKREELQLKNTNRLTEFFHDLFGGGNR